MCVTQHGFSAGGKKFCPLPRALCTSDQKETLLRRKHASPRPNSTPPEECMRKWKRDLWSGGREEGGEEEEGEIEYFTREGGARGRGRGRRRFLFPHPSRGTDYISFPPFSIYTTNNILHKNASSPRAAKAAPPYRRYRKFPFFKEIPLPIHSLPLGGGGGLEDN